MKALTISLLSFLLLLSCKSEEENMLYDFLNESTIKSVNISAKDLNIKIQSVKKVGVVVAGDSIPYYENSIIKLKPLLTTKTKIVEGYEFDKRELIKQRDKAIEPYFRSRFEEDIDFKEFMIVEATSDFLDIKSKYDMYVNRLNELKIDTSKVISHIYDLSYSMQMPDKNITNTFKRKGYTDSDNTEFVRIAE